MTVSILFVFTILSVIMINTRAQDDSLTTVSSLDLDRYSGLWYQIADYPQFYELVACQECVTATYSINSDRSVNIVNQALGINNCTIKGVAKGLDEKFPGELKIRFSFFPNAIPDSLLPDYWVVDLGEVNSDGKYSWAIVSNPKRSSCYVLSRSSTVSSDLSELIKGKLSSHGFDLTKLKWTNQDKNRCGYVM
jgi:apolipoprotein D and lipocalin family protein